MAKELPAAVSGQRKLVVEKMLQDMEAEGLRWVRPWVNAASPVNPVSGTVYSGGNRLSLAYAARARGYSDPRWVTFKQAKENG